MGIIKNDFTNTFFEIKRELPLMPRLSTNSSSSKLSSLKLSDLTGTYRGTSLIRKRHLPGPCSRPVPRVLGRSERGGRFLMSEVPLEIDRDGVRVAPLPLIEK